MRGLSLPGLVLPSGNRSAQGDHMHSYSQGFGLGPKSPLSQSLHANHSGGEMPLGRMDWSRTDFWLAVGTGKNRSSTTTSPCTPYPLPSELQGDKVGKDYLLQNLHRNMRTGLSNAISPESVLTILAPARFYYILRECPQGTHPARCNMFIMNILHLRPRVCCQKIARYFRNALSAHVC